MKRPGCWPIRSLAGWQWQLLSVQPSVESAADVNAVFKKYIFFQVMTPIEIRPSPCPSQASRISACKISPPYVAPFRSLLCEDANSLCTLETIVADFGDNLSPNSATVAEIGDYSLQCAQGLSQLSNIVQMYGSKYLVKTFEDVSVSSCTK